MLRGDLCTTLEEKLMVSERAGVPRGPASHVHQHADTLQRNSIACGNEFIFAGGRACLL